MHPQSELENYKLQVELLQEKLHRSEDNRQDLEGKLEQIMKKRNEHERTLRSRSQRKYQQFLDEQKKRNERNRTLVEMLERIDQQAAALSARSERLKMMKLQYELYFSKLVQSYSMKTLQGIPTTSFLPIQRPPNTYTKVKPDDVVPALLNNSTPRFQTVPIPVVVPIPNEQNRFQHSWAFATAPPGVLITLANNSTHLTTETDMCDNKKNESNFSFDYSQFPIGYLQTPTTSTPIQCNVGQSYLQQSQQQNQPSEIQMQPLFTPDDVVKQSTPDFETRDKTLSSFSFTNVRTDEPFSKRMHPESKSNASNLSSDITRRNNDLDISRDKDQPEIFPTIQSSEMPNNSTPELRESLKVDKLLNITPNNTFQQRIEDGRFVNRGNKPNTIDFRTDNDKYIKYIKEMKESYDKNAQAPLLFDVTPTIEHSIDNITTTLRIQKIDETNVEDYEKINDVEDNQKNTSSAFPPLGGKCSMESIGDEALMKEPLKNKTERNTSNTAARNIDLSVDTEQITLFNGTKNSKDERTGASNRTTAIIDGVGENTENRPVSTDSETSYRPLHFDKKEKMSIEKIETAIYGELLPKPESLTSADLPDKSKGNMDQKEIEQISQQPEKYEFNNSAKDSYELDTVGGGGHSVELYPSNNEQSDIKDAFAYDENVATGLQDYDYNYSDPSQECKEVNQEDAQNYTYSNTTQEYKEVNQEEVAQQEYPYTEDGQQPHVDSYETNYQNYDASEYHGEYDPNAYQYDYEQQQQYNDPNQGQYAPEVYNQEYQQDPYSGEYANYEQNASNEIDPSSQGYTDQQYAPEEPVVIEEQINNTIPPVQEPMEANAEVDVPSSIDQINEETTPPKEVTPTSILSTEKHTDLASKKKKRVNFVDSETDESSTLPKADTISSESDFDFSAN